MNTMTNDKWLDEMTLELRLHDVPGAVIGDARASVEAHCADAGESAQEAFGDPREYARALSLTSPKNLAMPKAGIGLVLPIAAGITGAFLVPSIVRALHEGAALASVSWGVIASLVMLGVLVWLAMKILRPMLDNWLVGAVFLGGGVVALGLVPRLLPAVAFALPVWVLGLISAILLAASVIGQRMMVKKWDDPIIDPRTPTQTPAALGLATQWLFVVVAVALGLIEWIPLLFS